MRWFPVMAAAGCPAEREGCDCTPDEFCATSTLCGAGDEYPSCALRPMECAADPVQVCGCDDVTYENACEANRSGTSVKDTGGCD